MLDYRTETFLTVCKTLNFTAAAKQLNITQPAVLSIPLSEVHAIRYRSPHNPLKKSIFF